MLNNYDPRKAAESIVHRARQAEQSVIADRTKAIEEANLPPDRGQELRDRLKKENLFPEIRERLRIESWRDRQKYFKEVYGLGEQTTNRGALGAAARQSGDWEKYRPLVQGMDQGLTESLERVDAAAAEATQSTRFLGGAAQMTPIMLRSAKHQMDWAGTYGGSVIMAGGLALPKLSQTPIGVKIAGMTGIAATGAKAVGTLAKLVGVNPAGTLIVAALQTGVAKGTYVSMSQAYGGNLYADLREWGLGHDESAFYSDIAGAVSGFAGILQLNAITAPTRKALAAFFASKPGKAVMGNFLKTYLGSVGAGIASENIQELATGISRLLATDEPVTAGALAGIVVDATKGVFPGTVVFSGLSSALGASIDRLNVAARESAVKSILNKAVEADRAEVAAASGTDANMTIAEASTLAEADTAAIAPKNKKVAKTAAEVQQAVVEAGAQQQTKGQEQITGAEQSAAATAEADTASTQEKMKVRAEERADKQIQRMDADIEKITKKIEADPKNKQLQKDLKKRANDRESLALERKRLGLIPAEYFPAEGALTDTQVRSGMYDSLGKDLVAAKKKAQKQLTKLAGKATKDGLRKGAQFARDAVKAFQTEISAFVRGEKGLTDKQRVQLLNQLKSVQTETQASKAFDKMLSVIEDMKEANAKRAEVDRFRKLINPKKLKKLLTGPIKEAINQIVEKFDPAEMTDKTVENLTQALQRIAELSKDEVLMSEGLERAALEAKTKRLGKTPFASLTLEEMQWVNNTLSQLLDANAQEQTMFIGNKQMAFSDIKNKVMETVKKMTKGKVKKLVQALDVAFSEGADPETRKAFGKYYATRPQELIKTLEGGARGILKEVFYDAPVKWFRVQKLAFEQQIYDEIGGILDKYPELARASTKYTDTPRSQLAQIVTDSEGNEARFASGKKVSLTPLEKVVVSLYLENERVAGMLMDVGMLPKGAQETVAAQKFTDESIRILRDSMTPAEQLLTKKFRQLINEVITVTRRDASMRHTGRDLTENQVNYLTVMRKRDFSGEVNVLSDEGYRNTARRRALENRSFAHERQDSSNPIIIMDAFELMDHMVRETVEYAFRAEPARVMRSLVWDTEVTRVFQEAGANEYLQYLRSMVRDFEEAGERQSPRSLLEAKARGVIRNFTSTALIHPKTAAKMSSSYGYILPEVGAANWAVGAAKRFSAGVRERAMQHPWVRDRIETVRGFSELMAAVGDDGRGKSFKTGPGAGAIKKAFGSVGDLIRSIPGKADANVVLATWAAVEAELGTTDVNIVGDRVMELFDNTQPVADSPLVQAPIARSRDLATRVYMLFSSQTAAINGMLRTAIIDYQNATNKVQALPKLIQRVGVVFASFAGLAALDAGFSEMMYEDSFEELDRVTKSFLLSMGVNVGTGGFYGWGQVIRWAAYVLATSRSDMPQTPLSQATRLSGQLLVDTSKAVAEWFDDGEIDEDRLLRLVKGHVELLRYYSTNPAPAMQRMFIETGQITGFLEPRQDKSKKSRGSGGRVATSAGGNRSGGRVATR